MKLTSASFADGGVIPVANAFCAPDPQTHARLSKNLNPQLSWSDFPPSTKSFLVVCHDPDVPSRGEDVNQEGRTVPASLARVDFFHWVLADLPPSVTAIAEGEYSSSVTARGKPGPAAPHGARQGVNDYTGWFRTDPAMSGDYYGYDGPCPPWNDEIVHRYFFTVVALGIARLPVDGAFTGAEARAAVQGHILDHVSIIGRYALNPAVKL